VRCNYILN